MNHSVILGIDLGTTNSLVGYLDGGSVKLIPNAFDEVLTPSVVHITDDIVTVGKVAKEMQIIASESTFALFKRSMGTNQVYGSKGYSSSELSSFVLRQLKQDAEQYLGVECKQAIISVPAYFNVRQRQATIEAAKLAGLEVLRLVNEPTAAAIANGIHAYEDDIYALVLDLGGGTFDVSLLEMFEGVLEVVSIAGDNMLGGEDFSQVIIDDIVLKAGVKYDALSKQDQSILRAYAERVKLECMDDEAREYYFKIGDYHIDYTFSNEKFMKLSKDLLTKIKLTIMQALIDANIDRNDISKIILMGGATRMKIFNDYVSDLFTIPFDNHLNPDETVAIGSVLVNALESDDKVFSDIVMTDVCGFTLGVEVVKRLHDGSWKDGVFSPIIKRNATLPTSVEHPYYSVHTNQQGIEFNIYQGESRDVIDNILLGKMSVPLPRMGADQVVRIRFTYDINGILEVEARIEETGTTQRIILKESGCTLSDEEISEKLKLYEMLKKQPYDEAKYQLLLTKLQKFYIMTNGNKQDEVYKYIELYKATLESQDIQKIKHVTKEIRLFIDYIEEYLDESFFKKESHQLH